MIDHVIAKAPLPSNTIIEGDCIEVMRSWPDGCVDHCIADPPFGIASGGGRGGNRKGLGWAFSSHVTMQETWDRFSEKDDFFRFNVDWLREVCRVVKPNGNILVFGTFHNIYQLGFILQNVLERRILNSIVWFKPNAQPNITARSLTESTEQIIWAVNETPKRAKNWKFNYWEAKDLAGGKQMRNLWNGEALNVWAIPLVPPSERRAGKHPAQKPLELTDRLVLLSSEQGNSIVDPFCGAGGVALSALRYRRNYVLIDHSRKYVEITNERIRQFRKSREGKALNRVEESGMTLNDAELTILRSVPVPQADELDLVFNVMSFVEEGDDTRAVIADRLKYVGRQGPYYADAAMALRLIGVTKSITTEGADRLRITPIGRGYLDASKAGKATKKRYIVLNSPIMKYVASQLGVTKNGESAPYPPSPELLDQEKVAGVLQQFDLSPDTARRRAGTLCRWLEQI
jgi:site-specific DNA-methyltransferase (adenine-specific)